MKGQLRLVDLENIAQEKVDYSIIMKEVLGYRNPWIGRKYVFEKAFLKAHELVEQAKKIDISKVQWSEDCKILKPYSIDNISFRAMMELQALLSDPSNKSIVQLIIETISIACYSANTTEKYLSESQDFANFVQKVANSNLVHMLGLYNWIDEELKESTKKWEKRFLSVKVEDKDYELAGGIRMSQFNVINTIKSLCNDFNCTEEDAWQKSYALTQTNSYEKASWSYTQDQMRQLKEIKMKRSREQKI